MTFLSTSKTLIREGAYALLFAGVGAAIYGVGQIQVENSRTETFNKAAAAAPLPTNLPSQGLETIKAIVLDPEANCYALDNSQGSADACDQIRNKYEELRAER